MKISNIKNKKPFSIYDIFLFLLIAIITITLFLCFFNFSKEKIEKVYIDVKDDNYLSFSFEDESFYINPSFSSFVETKKEGDVFLITIKVDNHYNVVKIDTTNKTVTMIDANCSNKDCLFSSSIKNKGDRIVCLPHTLIIYTDGNVMPNPSTGV